MCIAWRPRATIDMALEAPRTVLETSCYGVVVILACCTTGRSVTAIGLFHRSDLVELRTSVQLK
jgi:hypothetical protein